MNAYLMPLTGGMLGPLRDVAAALTGPYRRHQRHCPEFPCGAGKSLARAIFAGYVSGRPSDTQCLAMFAGMAHEGPISRLFASS